MNAARGEALVTLDGEAVAVCLTLGGLAELEHLLGCRALADLPLRLKHLSAAELKQVLDILVRGAGGTAALDRVSPGEAAHAVAEAFRAALG